MRVQENYPGDQPNAGQPHANQVLATQAFADQPIDAYPIEQPARYRTNKNDGLSSKKMRPGQPYTSRL